MLRLERPDESADINIHNTHYNLNPLRNHILKVNKQRNIADVLYFIQNPNCIIEFDQVLLATISVCNNDVLPVVALFMQVLQHKIIN